MASLILIYTVGLSPASWVAGGLPELVIAHTHHSVGFTEIKLPCGRDYIPFDRRANRLTWKIIRVRNRKQYNHFNLLLVTLKGHYSTFAKHFDKMPPMARPGNR